jgi:drug/metabolite transporter (DMT)-like permease
VADLALLVLTLFWGTTFTLVKQVLAVASPGVFLAARFGTAVAVLAAVALVRRERLRAGLSRHALLLGLFMLGGFAFQTVGLRYTTPARSGFITGLSVLIVPFLARFLLGRRVRPSAWIGIALAVGGLAILTRPFGGDLSAAVRLGDALTVGCAVTFALQVIFTSEWSPRHPLLPLTLVQVSVVFVGALVVLVPLAGTRFEPSGAAAFAATVMFTGVLMTAGAFLVMNWAQRHTTAVRAALIFSLEPVGAALFSHWYGGEPLSTGDWIGGGLIVLGVVVGEVGAALRPTAPPPVERPEA